MPVSCNVAVAKRSACRKGSGTKRIGDRPERIGEERIGDRQPFLLAKTDERLADLDGFDQAKPDFLKKGNASEKR